MCHSAPVCVARCSVPLLQPHTVDLTQEEIDVLSSHLEEQRIKRKVLADILYKLPDSEYGAHVMPEGYVPYCVQCDEHIVDKDDLGTAYGKFVHVSCARDGEGGTH